MGSNGTNNEHTIIVEHLDPELEDWQALEYKCIAEECKTEGWRFLLSGLDSATRIGKQLDLPTSNLAERSVESFYSTKEQKPRVCLLDPKAAQDLSPEDGELFDVFLFGGILGDEPPRDRTAELRKLGFAGRRLGSEQMTTDTAARVTRMVIQDEKRLEDIRYIDRPDIKLSAHTEANGGASADEAVSMPFKYVRGADGLPIMPKGMVDLLARDADKSILDLL